MIRQLNPPTVARRSLIADMAATYGMDPKPFEETLRKTVMPSQHTVEEFAACLMVAHQHNLNPVTREIFFMRAKSGGIQPIVSVDGWVKITNSNPAFDGMEFVDQFDGKQKLMAITCRMFRKDRTKPIEVTEYMDECKGESPAWKKTPSRMLRHRAMIQCARYAFGFAGIMEPDEFEQWQALPVQKSAHKARKDGDYERLTKGISDCTTVDDLSAYLLTNQEDIEALPNTWQGHLSDHASAKRARLEAPEAVEPLADEAGYLEKLKEDRELCTSVEDVAELKEANADLIERLSLAGKLKASVILEVE